MDEERIKAIALANQWREAVAHDQRSESKRLGTFLQDALESLGATAERDALDCGPFYAWIEDSGSAWDIKAKAISGAEVREPPAEAPRPLMKARLTQPDPNTPARFRVGQEFRWRDAEPGEPGRRPIILQPQFMPFSVGPTRAGWNYIYRPPGMLTTLPVSCHEDDIEPIEG